MTDTIATWLAVAFAASALGAVIWAVLNLRVNEQPEDNKKDESDE